MNRFRGLIFIGWLFAGAVVINPGYADYAFEFYCRGDTFLQVEPGMPAYFYFTLANTGTEPDIYQFDCQILQGVPGWSVIYCVRGRCFEPGVPMFDTLNPGEIDTTIDIAVFTTETRGEEVVSLTVRSQGNPALSATINTHTTVYPGVEEKGRILFSPRGDGWFSGKVFDPLGRRVSGITGSGVFFVLPPEGGVVKRVLRR